MLEESADEFHDFEGEDSWTVAVRLAIANEDGAVLDFDDARVGDSDFKDVGSEILKARFAGRYRLAVDVPVAMPEFSGDSIGQSGLHYLIAELGSKDFRESFDGEKEVDSGGMPRAIG